MRLVNTTLCNKVRLNSVFLTLDKKITNDKVHLKFWKNIYLLI